MPTDIQHSPGAPCWFDVTAKDVDASKRFYGGLFGWSFVDRPMGPDETYTNFQHDGRNVCGLYKTTDAIPPHWMVYFATPDARETAAKTTALGGSIVEGPFDIGELGRMMVCRDPGGAYFSVFQPGTFRGAGVINEDNAACWSELATRDTAQARDFYTGLFGWRVKSSANLDTYVEFSVDGRECGGLLPMDDKWKGIPSHWGIYIMVADCDAATAKAVELGATVRVGPMSMPGVGRFAILVDPQGAGFSLITLAPPPQ